MVTVPIVFLVAPYRNNSAGTTVQHIARVEAMCVELATKNILAVASHTNTPKHTINEPNAPSMEFWEDGYLRLMERCADAILLMPGWKYSKQCPIEYAKAKEMNLPIFETVDEVVEWAFAFRFER